MHSFDSFFELWQNFMNLVLLLVPLDKKVTKCSLEIILRQVTLGQESATLPTGSLRGLVRVTRHALACVCAMHVEVPITPCEQKLQMFN